MKKIRFGVFETNSSSTHSISINGQLNSEILPLKIQQFQKDYVDIFDDKIHISLDEECEFGWGYQSITNSWGKFSYAIMMVIETEGNECKTIEDVYNTEGFLLIQSLFDKKIIIEDDSWHQEEYTRSDGKVCRYVEHSGYIDHQSCEDYSSLKYFLYVNGITIEDFIFDENVELIISNDNN